MSDLLPADERGTGFGALQAVLGVAALPASVLTGYLMTRFGSQIALTTSASFALLGVVGLFCWHLLKQKKVAS